MGGRPAGSGDAPSRLTQRHFPALIPPAATMQNPLRECRVHGASKKDGKRVRKQTRYMWVLAAAVWHSCVVPCFQRYHTLALPSQSVTKQIDWVVVQTCIWPSWCHCHSLSLASVKSTLVLPFWYRLTWVVPDKGPLNVCVCVCVISLHFIHSPVFMTFRLVWQRSGDRCALLWRPTADSANSHAHNEPRHERCGLVLSLV